jgi:hypothetical protein
MKRRTGAAWCLAGGALLALLLAGCRGGAAAVPGSGASEPRGDLLELLELPSPRRRYPEGVSALAAGGRESASAAWFGFDPEDATAALQAAIRSGARRLLVPDMGTPWQTGPLELAGDQAVYFEPGAVLLAKKGLFLAKGDSLLSAWDSENILLYGYGASLRMRKEDYSRPPYPASQWRNTLSLRGCRNVRVFGLKIADSGGDGIYVRGGKTLRYCENIHIKDVVLEGHHRQGISVISVRNLFVENTRITATRGTPPQAGIDFEPNYPDERLERCLIRNCTISGNRGPGVLAYLARLDQGSPQVSIAVEGSDLRGNRASVWIDGVRKNPPGEIVFSGNTLGWLRHVKRSAAPSIVFRADSYVPLEPLASAGGPYTLTAGEALHLDGGASAERDRAGGIIRWEWSVAGRPLDGCWGDRPLIPWEVLSTRFGLAPGGSFPIALRVMDDDYQWSGRSETTLTIKENDTDP